MCHHNTGLNGHLKNIRISSFIQMCGSFTDQAPQQTQALLPKARAPSWFIWRKHFEICREKMVASSSLNNSILCLIFPALYSELNYLIMFEASRAWHQNQCDQDLFSQGGLQWHASLRWLEGGMYSLASHVTSVIILICSKYIIDSAHITRCTYIC